MTKVLVLRASGKIRPVHLAGVDVIQVPVIDIVPNEHVINEVSLDNADYVIVMSTTVVKYVGERLRRLNNAKIIGVGPQTCSEIEKLGVACIMPREFSSYGIINMMRDLPRGKVVVLRSLRGGNYIVNELKGLGFDVVEYGIYDIRPNSINAEIACKLMNYVDYIIFMSPPMTYEAVRNCAGDVLKKKPAIAIGRVTESRMRSDGINPPLTPSEYTLNGVLRLLTGHLMTSNESPD
ncbi:uroporphyrinogen-III synthase [Vulcanisaeta distributa]|uniref:uroporphyrinogen-III synthase n=1 Tax=Vulcanisaeta distributa TaxID=164451 RepID=UPI0006D0D041|nr:uroporphyrinogen-III synthase [Vulcanisaeta distributa]